MIDKKLTLGSLFDGSGGFPLGAVLTGIEPLWASEVEPFPIRVTTKRFPNMEHYGDINYVDGAVIPSVDIITAGFCCQDLSVAGKRAGLSGERSGLFYQIPRIVKEMRMATDNEYPKFVVLENVPGMYTSNGGLDFLEVLNELIRIKDETVSVPMPASGRWTAAGDVVGNNFSLAWRTLDAQYWGVPQRRRRCFIVLDLGGARAGEILFDEARLRGNYAPGGGAGKEAAGSAGDRAAPAGRVNYLTPWDSQRRRIVSDDGLSPTLNEADGGGGRNPGGYVLAVGNGQLHSVYMSEQAGTLNCMHDQQVVMLEHHPLDSRIKIDGSGTTQTLTERMGTGGGNVPLVLTEIDGESA